MKTIITLLVLLITANANAQKLLNFTHKFTGEKWKETTWEPFLRKGAKSRGFEVDQRFRKVDGAYFFDIVIQNQNKTHFIDKGDVIAFKDYSDSTILTIQCVDPIDTRDAKDVGSYAITVEQMELLLNNDVKDVFLEYRLGYKRDGLTQRKLIELRNSIMLITMSKRFDKEEPRVYNKTR